MTNKLEPIPELQTDRLLLRKLSVEDAPILFQYWADDDVTRFMNIPPFQHVEQATDMIVHLNTLSERQEASRWGIVLKETGTLIGTCGFNTSWAGEDRRSEIGYDLGKPYWGRGYMTEALRALVSHGFDQLDLNRIEALVEPGNTGSIKTLGKVGFQQEGLLRDYQFAKGRFVDLRMFSLLRREYVR
ncbi:GNAT family N-acetyltransferase [Brevibacillus humidisoli]|uniref:GNAT family N-acetyltransferase n=1 Tax=Brevibacillus humidisoli TaxID=2895522 RepID=UPI001E2B691E|nr:GNAT family protein [Brevibacillus humidisoli]UFJ41584.1 GNAT family N-acetyltransferase [Brevibacillus humidisoli]